MEFNDWIVLATALGGVEGIKQLVKWWMNRKGRASKRRCFGEWYGR